MFRMDWLDLLAVQGTLKSLPQHYSSKVSIRWCSAVFTVQVILILMLINGNDSLKQRLDNPLSEMLCAAESRVRKLHIPFNSVAL